MDANLLLAFAAFAGAVVGSAGTIFVNARIADKDRLEQRRRERTEFILHSIQALVQLFAQYEEFIQKDAGAFRSVVERSAIHARIIGQAIAEILAVDDPVLSEIATDRLTPNMVEAKDNPAEHKKYGDFKNRNRNAMMDALKQLGQLMRETISSQP
ncbi:MAG: hypothetical protein K8L99_30115 [Anaerolineae bacterium]|nr:hypothetical protein [Anaerolineae bacterium]